MTLSRCHKSLRPASQSRDNSQPISGQYSGHVISIGEPEASIQVRDRDNSGPVWPQHRQIYNNLDKDKNKLPFIDFYSQFESIWQQLTSLLSTASKMFKKHVFWCCIQKIQQFLN